MHKLPLFLVCLAIANAACSSSSDSGSGASDAGTSSSDEDSGSGRRDAGTSSRTDAGAKDSGTASVGTVSDGAEGKSCTDACKSQSMHCTPTCEFNDSLHGGTVGPYAGSGFYSYTTDNGGGDTFTTNANRFEASCDTVFTSTWTDNPDDPGTPYVVDYTYTSTPIACCCAH